MVKRWSLIVFLALLLQTAWGQQMEISGFRRLKKGLLNRNGVTTDKQMAIIDLKTGEKGFTFKANGTTEVQAEEGDGMLTLMTPDKTKFLVVTHDDYGQLTWKVPEKKGLRKKKHYEANLLTYSPTKEYKLQQQWVVFDINPRNAILVVDSVSTTVRTGVAQMSLAVGMHAYHAESPFYEPQDGTFEVSDTAKLRMQIELQPFYSYLTVSTPLEGCKIMVDDAVIGTTEATSGRLLEGRHKLSILYDGQYYYNRNVTIGRAEKKRIELKAADLYPRTVPQKVQTAGTTAVTDTTGVPVAKQASVVASVAKTAPVTILAPDSLTEIWINRELVGTGTWEGELPFGFHALNTRKDGVESKVTMVWVEDTSPKFVNLLAPMADYGLVNVHCNEVGAAVYINGTKRGVTPCVIKDLPASQTVKVKLQKDGFKDAETKVTVVGNDMVDVKLKLKRK